MEIKVILQIEKITREDGSHYYLATSDDVQGLVAQADSIEEVVEIAEDLTKLLFELDEEWKKQGPQAPNNNIIEYPLLIKI